MGMQTSTTSSGKSGSRQDALALLIADHRKVGALFDQFQSALDDDESEEQQQLAAQICQELEIHSKIEEQIFYPAIAQDASLKGLVDEALSEHSEVDAAVSELKGMQSDDPDFSALMLQLIDDVKQHVEEEEYIMFPRVEERMGDEMAALGARLQERKSELMSQQRGS